MSYTWLPNFLLFGPPGSGKTKFPSYFRNYKWPDGRDITYEIADVGHALYSWDPLPDDKNVFPIGSFEQLVKYLYEVNERNSDLILVDDLSFLNYKMTMESAQLRKGVEGKDDDTSYDVKKMIQSQKFTGLRFIPPSLRDRGVAAEKLRILLYNLLEMNKIIVVTCGASLEAEKITAKIGSDPIFTGNTYRLPSLPGQLAYDAPHFFSEVFYMYRVAGAQEVSYRLRFLPDGGNVEAPKDRSGRLQKIPGAERGVIKCDKYGKFFDNIVNALPWPEGRKPVKR